MGLGQVLLFSRGCTGHPDEERAILCALQSYLALRCRYLKSTSSFVNMETEGSSTFDSHECKAVAFEISTASQSFVLTTRCLKRHYSLLPKIPTLSIYIFLFIVYLSKKERKSHCVAAFFHDISIIATAFFNIHQKTTGFFRIIPFFGKKNVCPSGSMRLLLYKRLQMKRRHRTVQKLRPSLPKMFSLIKPPGSF